MSNQDQTIAELRLAVAAQRGRFDELSARCGMSKSWLSKFAAGRFASPKYSTVQRVRDAVDTMSRKAAA